MAQSERFAAMLENTLEEARSRAGTVPSQAQILAVVTERGPRYFELDYRDPEARGEDAVLAALEEDRKVLAVLSVWKGGCLDIPSVYFRQGLLALAPENGEAYVLLQGEGRILTKKLADTL